MLDGCEKEKKAWNMCANKYWSSRCRLTCGTCKPATENAVTKTAEAAAATKQPMENKATAAAATTQPAPMENKATAAAATKATEPVTQRVESIVTPFEQQFAPIELDATVSVGTTAPCLGKAFKMCGVLQSRLLAYVKEPVCRLDDSRAPVWANNNCGTARATATNVKPARASKSGRFLGIDLSWLPGIAAGSLCAPYMELSASRTFQVAALLLTLRQTNPEKLWACNTLDDFTVLVHYRDDLSMPWREYDFSVQPGTASFPSQPWRATSDSSFPSLRMKFNKPFTAKHVRLVFACNKQAALTTGGDVRGLGPTFPHICAPFPFRVQLMSSVSNFGWNPNLLAVVNNATADIYVNQKSATWLWPTSTSMATLRNGWCPSLVST